MRHEPSVILIEYNELSPELMDRFIRGGHLPTFARFRAESQVYVTEAKERYPYLDPWIQWVTVHSGTNFEEHGIEQLDEGHKLRTPNIWDVLSDAKLPVWVCGSMSVAYDKSLDGAVLPDPWTTKVAPRPRELAPFFDFVQRNVLEYSNDRVPLSKRAYLEFVAFMLRHGLSKRTLAAIASQLVSEKATKRGRWKRATLLDKLQYDLFAWYWRTKRPRFSTFFSNSTAHFQHLYWRNMEPELFATKPTEEQQRDLGDAILHGYEEMDAMLARFLDLADSQTTLIFATALSQQACLKFEAIGGKSIYRPRRFEELIRFLELPEGTKATPVMAQEFYLELPSEAAAIAAAEKLASLRVLGRDAMQVERKGNLLFTGCRIKETIPEGSVMTLESTGASRPFFDVFYKIEGLKSGMHHPEGLLWIRRPDRAHAVHDARVPLDAIAPTILDMFAVTKPESMKAPPLSGFSRIAHGG